MKLNPDNPFDVYFALRLAFVDRPEVRIRLQEPRLSPGRHRFAPDPTLWAVQAYALDEHELEAQEGQGYSYFSVDLIERELVQAGSLNRSVQEAGVGSSALLARDLYDQAHNGFTMVIEPGPGDRRRFSFEVLSRA